MAARRPASQRLSRTTAPRRRAAPPVRHVAFVSLGCPKNLVDSEKMLGLLAEDGLVPVSDAADADAIVINTCGFLEAAKAESLQEIEQAVGLKKTGRCRRVVVAGCLVQRHRAKLLEWCPGIDAFIGVFDRDRIVQAVRGPVTTGGRRMDAQANLPLPVYSSIAGSSAVARQQRHIKDAGYWESDAARLRLTPRHYAYLRISEGCNQHCAFCTIPSIRGKMRSKPLDTILAEAAELLSDGAFELNLIGQDTTSYGHDIGYAGGLAGMLTALDRLAAEHGGAWLRLMYAYPSCFTDDMIDALTLLPGVVKYIDMPLQHINDRVLNAMRRRTSRRLIVALLEKLRRRVPGIAIRTTFISGFPGEIDSQHRELVEFVREARFEALGVFAYSPEPGTPAGSMHADGRAVADEVVQARVEELMLTQQAMVLERNADLAAHQVEVNVLIDAAAHGKLKDVAHYREEPPVHAYASSKNAMTDGRTPTRGRLYVGRTSAQAPQVDAVTYVVSRAKLAAGEVVRCRIVDHRHYDLVAQPAEDLDRTVRLAVIEASA